METVMGDTFEMFWDKSSSIGGNELGEFFRQTVSGNPTVWAHADGRAIAANGIEQRRCPSIDTLSRFRRTGAFSADVSVYERDAAELGPFTTDAAVSAPIETGDRNAGHASTDASATATRRERVEGDRLEEMGLQSACRDCGRSGAACTCHLWS
jgi:hypothetical protein